MTRRIPTIAAGLTMAALLGGCAGSAMVGTWRGEDSGGEAPFEFGAVTFAPDGTYTAQMLYSGVEKGDSGTWSIENGTLLLNDGDRSYAYVHTGDVLTIEDGASGHSVVLNRFK